MDNQNKKGRSFRLDRIVKVEATEVDSFILNIAKEDSVSEKIVVKSKSWNASNIVDLNIPYSLSGEEMTIELDLYDADYLLELLLRLDAYAKVECSRDTRVKLIKILKNRIDAIR
jgi:predicted DNA-binding transcriptional regulator YafY